MCNGKGYTPKQAKSAATQGGDAVQFNIGIQFPNCWDGVNLKPAHGVANATYDERAMPVHVSGENSDREHEHRLRASDDFSLDTSKVQLSMDPIMHGDEREERWGSLYTAHADFMNGWTEDGARFMTEPVHESRVRLWHHRAICLFKSAGKRLAQQPGARPLPARTAGFTGAG
jgi:hypothetical protein